MWVRVPGAPFGCRLFEVERAQRGLVLRALPGSVATGGAGGAPMHRLGLRFRFQIGLSALTYGGHTPIYGGG
jgi:hypothetical protein